MYLYSASYCILKDSKSCSHVCFGAGTVLGGNWKKNKEKGTCFHLSTEVLWIRCIIINMTVQKIFQTDSSKCGSSLKIMENVT